MSVSLAQRKAVVSSLARRSPSVPRRDGPLRRPPERGRRDDVMVVLPSTHGAHTGRKRPHKEDLGPTKPQVRTGAPPGTRTPNPRIKSPLLRVFEIASWCRLMLVPADPCGNPQEP